ncbi:hypothetical protein ABIB66_008307 [Bradyrhizobium sp. F1.13.3]
MSDHDGLESVITIGWNTHAHLLPVDPQRLNRCRSGANEVAHRFVTFIGNPHSRQLAGA